MAEDVAYDALPFDEAINFFRQKIRMPTERWNDIWQGMHARAFVVAGADKDELLSDLYGSIDKAISEGTTLDEFRNDFDGIVSKHGWSYKGERGWRTDVMLNTNIRQSYNAGRWQQLTDPDLLKSRPYLEYIHGDSVNPRPLHLEWHGTVLPANDQWWSTHYPQNGWGCSCKVFARSLEDLQRAGKSGPDRAPANGTYTWTDKTTGELHTIPKGIDPGFSYNVGQAAWGRQLSGRTMSAYKSMGAKAFESLTPGDYKTYQRPATIPLDKPVAKLGVNVHSTEQIVAQLRGILGGEEKVFDVKGIPVLVNAESLGKHIDANRSTFLPFIEETLNEPFEVWTSFEKHKGTGKVHLRHRVIKAVDTGKGKGFLVVANASKGMLEAWTFVPSSNLKYLNKQRVGKLMWGRK